MIMCKIMKQLVLIKFFKRTNGLMLFERKCSQQSVQQMGMNLWNIIQSYGKQIISENIQTYLNQFKSQHIKKILILLINLSRLKFFIWKTIKCQFRIKSKYQYQSQQYPWLNNPNQGVMIMEISNNSIYIDIETVEELMYQFKMKYKKDMEYPFTLNYQRFRHFRIIMYKTIQKKFWNARLSDSLQSILIIKAMIEYHLGRYKQNTLIINYSQIVMLKQLKQNDKATHNNKNKREQNTNKKQIFNYKMSSTRPQFLSLLKYNKKNIFNNSIEEKFNQIYQYLQETNKVVLKHLKKEIISQFIKTSWYIYFLKYIINIIKLSRQSFIETYLIRNYKFFSYKNNYEKLTLLSLNLLLFLDKNEIQYVIGVFIKLLLLCNILQYKLSINTFYQQLNRFIPFKLVILLNIDNERETFIQFFIYIIVTPLIGKNQQYLIVILNESYGQFFTYQTK
ncbi:hypothetical protein pb186bvf_020518 [Paramecium bursaria]